MLDPVVVALKLADHVCAMGRPHLGRSLPLDDGERWLYWWLNRNPKRVRARGKLGKARRARCALLRQIKALNAIKGALQRALPSVAQLPGGRLGCCTPTWPLYVHLTRVPPVDGCFEPNAAAIPNAARWTAEPMGYESASSAPQPPAPCPSPCYDSCEEHCAAGARTPAPTEGSTCQIDGDALDALMAYLAGKVTLLGAGGEIADPQGHHCSGPPCGAATAAPLGTPALELAGPLPICAAAGITSTLPDGVAKFLAGQKLEKDDELGVHYCDHPDMTPEQQHRLLQALRDRKSAVIAYTLADLGTYKHGEVRIKLRKEEPLTTKQKPLSPGEQEIQDEKCTEMRDAIIIERALLIGEVDPNDPLSPGPLRVHNVVLPGKKDENGMWTDRRFCVNFIPTNVGTISETHGLHRADELHDRVAKCKFITKLDLRSGFFQIKVAERDRPKTAFWWRNEVWQFVRAPFGLKNLPMYFQRMMDEVLSNGGCSAFASAFIDDVLVHSNTAEEHIQHVAKVLDALIAAGLKIHPSKSYVGCYTLEYLGHLVSAYGLQPVEARVKAIKEMPAPRGVSELRSALGLFNYYRTYVPRYADIAHPLNQLLRKDAPWRWGEAEAQSYEALKAALCTEGLALRRVDPSQPLRLHTDFSKVGISAVLGQLDQDGKEYLCAAASRSCNPAEQNYDSYKGELMACVWGVKTFRHYLHGADFTLYTDHQPLQYLMAAEGLTGQYARWAMMMQQFSFEVVHRPGVTHQNADGPSRLPLASDEDPTGARLDHEPPKPVRLRVYIEPGDACPYCGQHSQARRELNLPAQPPWVKGRGTTASPALAAQEEEVAGPAVALLDAPAWQGVPVDPLLCFVNELRERPAWIDEMAPSTDYFTYGHWGDPLDSYLRSVDLPDADPAPKTSPQLSAKLALGSVATHLPPPAGPGRAAPAGPQPPATPGLHNVDTTPLAAGQWATAVRDGLILFEPFGGLCPCLEAVLQLGVKVRQYVYCDISQHARKIAAHRVQQLSQQYPALFPEEAWEQAFTILPHDVNDISSTDLHSAGLLGEGGQVLLCAGWECQDLSTGGNRLGLSGPRSQTYYPLLKLVATLQAYSRVRPPAYILENVNFRYHADFPQVKQALGNPLLLDAAQFGSYCHRVRLFWTNLCCPVTLDLVLHAHQPDPNMQLTDILEPGRQPQPVSKAEEARREGRYQRNREGKPRVLLPTLCTAPASKSFMPGKPGCIWADGRPTVPTALERERAMGLLPGSTSATGVSEPQRITAIGNAMSIHNLAAMLASAIAVHQRDLQHDHPAAPAIAALAAAGSVLGGDTPTQAFVFHHVTNACNSWHPFALAAAAAAQDAQDGATKDADIWHDHHTYHFLVTGQVPPECNPSEARRVRKRAQRYRLIGKQLYRRMVDGRRLLVPPLEQRLDLVQQAHSKGHFGRNRTEYLLRCNYWWSGLQEMVDYVVRRCPHCSRVKALLDRGKDAQLHPLPVESIGWRWSLDYAGPLVETKGGNSYLLVAIEHTTKWVEVAATPNKASITSARFFLQQVLSRFGAPAEVLTDQGKEFLGEFHQLLQDALIDHRITSRYHPQADGLAERFVRTIKNALRCHCDQQGRLDQWDEELPWALLAYRCAAQSSTKYSPYYLLFGRHPIIPPATFKDLEPAIDYTDPDEAAKALASRVPALKRHGVLAMENIKVAQHRQTLQYARLRGGGLHPSVFKFKPGDFVHVYHEREQGLEPPVLRGIYQVVDVGKQNVVTLRGRCGQEFKDHINNLAPCHLPDIDPTIDPTLAKPDKHLPCQVCRRPDAPARMLLCDNCSKGWHAHCLVPPQPEVPDGMWVCPTCHEAGVTKSEVEQRSAQRDQAALSAKMLRDDAAAASMDGKLVSVRVSPGGRGQRAVVKQLPLQFRGAEARPHYFSIHVEGEEEPRLLTLSAAKRVLVRSQGSGVITAFALTADVSAQLPERWKLYTTEGCAEALQILMPGTPTDSWSAGHITHLCKLVPGHPLFGTTTADYNPGEPMRVVTTPAEVQVLLDNVDFKECTGFFDPFSGECNIQQVFSSAGYRVLTNDINPALGTDHHIDALQPVTYQKAHCALNGGLQVVITSPLFAVLDLAVPLAVKYATKLVAAHVPGHYVTDAHGRRLRWLSSLGDRVVLLTGLPRGPSGKKCVWMCVFASAAVKQQMMRPSAVGVVSRWQQLVDQPSSSNG